ncbi:MAG: S-layer homology domain-containing protein [Pelotomaculum sp.]
MLFKKFQRFKAFLVLLALFTLVSVLTPLPLLQPSYGATLTAAAQAGRAIDFIKEQYLSGQTVDGFAAYILELAGEDLSGDAWKREGDHQPLRAKMDSLAGLLGDGNTLITYIIATQNSDGTFGPYANEYCTKVSLQALAAVAGDTTGTEVNDRVNKAISHAVSYFQEGYRSGSLTYEPNGWSFDYRCVAALASAGEDLAAGDWVYDGQSLQEKVLDLAGEAAANPELRTPVELAKELIVLLAVDPASPDIAALAEGIIARADSARPGQFGDSIYDDVLVLNALGQAGWLGDLDQNEILDYLNTYRHVHYDSMGEPAGASWGGFTPAEPDLTAQVLNTLAYCTDAANPDSGVYGAIRDGLAYLNAIQDQNTAAITAEWDSTYATAETLLALKALGWRYEDYAGEGSAWLKKSPTKTIAQCLLAANKSEDNGRVDRLVNLLAGRQIAAGDGEGSFENSVYSDMWAYLALGEAGRLNAIDTGAACSYILAKQGADGSWGETFGDSYYPDVLSTTQAIRSLTYFPDAASPAVQAAIDKGLLYLKSLQQPDGGIYAAPFDDPAIDNSELVVTLYRLKQDPAAVEWENEAGLTPVDYLLNNTMNEDGSFGTSRNIMGAAEALSALLLVTGEGNPSGGGGGGGSGTPPDEDVINVRIAVVGADGRILFGPGSVRVSRDGLWGQTVLGTLDATGLSYTADAGTGFVSDIEGLTNSGMNGWMFKVNEVVATTSGKEQRVREGDRIVWWYSQDINSTGPGWNELQSGYIALPGADNAEVIDEYQSLEQLTSQEVLAKLKELNHLLGLPQDKSELGNVEEAGPAVHVVGGDKLLSRSSYLSLQAKLTANTVHLKQLVATGTGAIISDTLNEITLVIPGGALSQDQEIIVTKASTDNLISYPAGYLPVTAVFSFGPDGTYFNKPVACTLKIALPPLVKTDNLVLAYYNKAEEAWIALPAVVDADNGLILAQINHFSDYIVLAKLEKKPFVDVTPAACGWALEAIETLAGAGVLDGTDYEHYMPDLPITRAELTKLLVKALNLPADETATTFIDVPDTAWYAGYTAAAAGAGLVKGYEDGSFRPHRPVTREELAVILVRGLELTARPGATLPFNDAEEVFTWAKDSVTIAAGCGLLHGYPDGTFRPRGQVTRAESAVMLYRALCNEIK